MKAAYAAEQPAHYGLRPNAPYGDYGDGGRNAHCIAYQCHDKPHARRLCGMHYWRWHSGERIDLDAGSMERDLVERALANAAEAARRRELHTARLAGSPLERALATGHFDACPRR